MTQATHYPEQNACVSSSTANGGPLYKYNMAILLPTHDIITLC